MNVFNKYTRAKIYLRFKNLFEKAYQKPTDRTQEYVMKIASNLISNPDTEFVESPIEHLIYIHWDHITIKFYYDDCKVVMMNGKYYYYFTMPLKSVEKLKSRIYRIMSLRANKWEKKFDNDTITNLQHILEEVQQKDK
jgi:hypothetical protein